MTRAEHLQWAKTRALEYVDKGALGEAFSSMSSDLQKHTETANHIGLMLGMQQMPGGMLSTQGEMRDFILGFN